MLLLLARFFLAAVLFLFLLLALLVLLLLARVVLLATLILLLLTGFIHLTLTPVIFLLPRIFLLPALVFLLLTGRFPRSLGFLLLLRLLTLLLFVAGRLLLACQLFSRQLAGLPGLIILALFFILLPLSSEFGLLLADGIVLRFPVGIILAGGLLALGNLNVCPFSGCFTIHLLLLAGGRDIWSHATSRTRISFNPATCHFGTLRSHVRLLTGCACLAGATALFIRPLGDATRQSGVGGRRWQNVDITFSSRRWGQNMDVIFSGGVIRIFRDAGISDFWKSGDPRATTLKLILAMIFLKPFATALPLDGFFRPLTTFHPALPETIADLGIDRSITFQLNLVDPAADLLGPQPVIPFRIQVWSGNPEFPVTDLRPQT